MLVLHLGAGRSPRPKWINIDLNAETHFAKDGTISLKHDLREGLPFQDDYFDAVYSSHFLEHLDAAAGLELMKHCLRVLKPGGIFRAALPDVRPVLKAYVAGDQAYFDWELSIYPKALPKPRSLLTPIDFIDRIARGWDHQMLYDPQKATVLLQAAGFDAIEEAEFDPAFDEPGEIRRAFSFYMLARKPG
jgi:predicted SAM-dependent methyltransferase